VNDDLISYDEDELEIVKDDFDACEEKYILSNIFDVLANNTMYVEPERIADDFDVRVDFDEKTIELINKETQELVVVLKAIFPSEETKRFF
jgi:hypothetical protein